MPIDFLQSPRMQSLQNQAESSQNEDDKRRFLVTLAREVVKALSEVAVTNLPDSVSVNNLDEIKASLRNELSKANKPITDILNKLNVSTIDQTKLIEDIERKAQENISNTYETVTIKRLKNKVEIENLSDIVFPSDVKINNLSELIPYLQDLNDKISALKLDVILPAPQVTVNPTAVNIPETVLNVPATDLEPIISALDKNLKLLRTNNKSNPIAVRWTDGAEWIKEVRNQTAKTTQFMSDVSYIKDANGLRINPATAEGQGGANSIGDGSKNVTTAGTRVQLTSTTTACRYVLITAVATNTDTIWIGGSTVAAGRGRPLVALQGEKFDINDVSKIWIDSVVNGEGVTYAFVA